MYKFFDYFLYLKAKNFSLLRKWRLKQEKKLYLNNFYLVEKKMRVVLDKDSAKKFQSPVRGKEIMEIFGLEESKEVGLIKKSVEDAILDGEIENTYEAAKEYLIAYKNK